MRVSAVYDESMDPNRTQALDPNRTQLGAAPTVDPNRTVMGHAPTVDATVTIKPVQCPVCKTFNPAGMMFCVECGLIFDRALPDDAFGAPTVQLPVLVEQSGREHVVRPGENLIGREGDIALADPRVSRRHAALASENGAFFLSDLGSTNGTSVNGSKLAPNERKEVKEGDKLSFGGLELQLSLPGQKSGNVTQAFASNKTAAISAPPRVEQPAARLTGSGHAFPLKPGTNTFGRRSENDVQITDPYVSGKHGIIEIGDDGIFLTDVGSTNGTLLNEAKLVPNMRTKISSEDVIRLGSLELRVELTENP
jgi:pSer/pThr/pTyr-binding forkhead associated (FHA) protein